MRCQSIGFNRRGHKLTEGEIAHSSLGKSKSGASGIVETVRANEQEMSRLLLDLVKQIDAARL